MDFEEFPKIPRLMRRTVVTEKIDGVNAQIVVPLDDDAPLLSGSRSKWVTPDDDLHGFAKWVKANTPELRKLGPGRHYGEWWGVGIGRRYGLSEKRFSLFNVSRWNQDNTPTCVGVVPTLYDGVFSLAAIDAVMADLAQYGSRAAPGFMKPEGVIVYHDAAQQLFKLTLDSDGPKGA